MRSILRRLELHLTFVVFCFSPLVTHAELKWEKRELMLKAEIGDTELVGIFKFTNVGSETVKITHVEVSCGCTATTLLKKTYAPGESGEIETTFTIGDRVGPQNLGVKVTTDKADKPYVLLLKTDIPELLKIQPRVVMWNVGGKHTSKKIDIKVKIDEAVDIEVLTESSTFKASLETVEEGKHYILTVTPRYTGDPGRTIITLQTNYPLGKPEVLKVYAYVHRAPGQPLPVPGPERVRK